MPNDPEQPVVRLDKVSKNYAEKQVLQGIDFEISRGQVVGYLGANGAGKTTTVKILIGVTGEFYGKAEVCGFDLREQALEVKQRIGYVPEAAVLYDALTPLEFVRFIGRIHHMEDSLIEQRALEMLSALGMRRELKNPMQTFSKGMRQKVLITASLIHDPEVIFLDEPMSGLDANSVVLIKEVIALLARAGKTVFYCSHMLDIVERVCDRIIVLDKGTIVADGSLAELQGLRRESSLEAIFTQLTSENDNVALARQFVKSLKLKREAI